LIFLRQIKPQKLDSVRLRVASDAGKINAKVRIRLRRRQGQGGQKERPVSACPFDDFITATDCD
jgi:hypothetical protein